MGERGTCATRTWLARRACAAALVWLAQGTSLAAQMGAQTPNAPAEEQRPAPAAAPQPPVSLQEAIQIAYQNHGSIAVAEENVEAARQRIREARTGTLPSVTGSVTYAGSGTNNFGGLFGGAPTQTVVVGVPPNQTTVRVPVDVNNVSFSHGLQPQIGVNYPVFDSGLTRASVRQARASYESTGANLVAVRNNLTFTVTTNYLAQLRSERILELRVVQENLAAEQLRSVEARIRAGAAAEADRALVLSELRNRQVDRIAAQNDVRVSANALRNSMGLPVGPPLPLVELSGLQDPLPPVEQLRATAERQRPEVIQAEAQVRVAEQGVSIARIGRKPRLDTTFQFNVAPTNQLQRSSWSIAAGISMPLWDAGLTHAREQVAKTDVQAATATLEQTKKDVAADVQEAYLNLANARERLAASRLAAEAAQVNLEATTARYQVGAGASVVDLIQAQVEYATANNNVIQSQYDVYLAQAQLNRAIGRI